MPTKSVRGQFKFKCNENGKRNIKHHVRKDLRAANEENNRIAGTEMRHIR